ncbi:Protein argonaute 12 [Hordeum vulgare]|nr:Protein argonaute 12 [Hordeum vulgare]
MLLVQAVVENVKLKHERQHHHTLSSCISGGTKVWRDGHDISATTFYKAQEVMDFAFEYLNICDASRPLIDRDRIKVCSITAGQRYSRKLNERQVSSILKMACERPAQRESSVLEIVNRNNYGNDDYSKEFGMKVMNLFALVDARVLPAPTLGQALSTRPDILPIAYCQELLKLQDQIPPFPTRNAIRTIESELGSRMSDLFADISPEPIAAASLGQVYKVIQSIQFRPVFSKLKCMPLIFQVMQLIYTLESLSQSKFRGLEWHPC